MALASTILTPMEWYDFDTNRKVKKLSRFIMTHPMRQFQAKIGYWIQAYQAWLKKQETTPYDYSLQYAIADLRVVIIESLEYLDSLGTVQERVAAIDNIIFDEGRAKELKEKISQALQGLREFMD